MYEHFEHTADLGLRVRAGDLDELFRDAAEGLFAMIVEGLDPDDAGSELKFSIDGGRTDFLLFDWLNELLFVFETRELLLDRFDVKVGESGLQATAQARPLDVTRHRTLHEVKAITYHGLRVEEIGDGWLAEVIVDI